CCINCEERDSVEGRHSYSAQAVLHGGRVQRTWPLRSAELRCRSVIEATARFAARRACDVQRRSGDRELGAIRRLAGFPLRSRWIAVDVRERWWAAGGSGRRAAARTNPLQRLSRGGSAARFGS